jgi:hypothetical protein
MSPGLRLLALLGLGPLVGVTACHRALPVADRQQARDAGRDVGAPAAGDAGRVDASDVPPSDAQPSDTRSSDDGSTDDAAGGVCSVGVPPLNVCGCGCCGGTPGSAACYYPARGESRDAIPNPMPSASACANVGCSFGVHYLCCADPGGEPPGDGYCAANTSIEDLPQFTVTRRDGAVCTTLELAAQSSPQLPISAPAGFVVMGATRGACGAASPAARAIGGLGSVSPSQIKHGDPTARYDVHVALFFDSGGGVADAVRLDVDDIPISPGPCFPGAGADGGPGSTDAGCQPDALIWSGCNFCSCTSMGVMICSERACPTGDAGGAQ